MTAIFNIVAYWFTLSFEDFESKLREKVETEGLDETRRPEKISLSLLPITTSKIYGRKTELDQLDDAWQDDNVNVLQMIAFGGVGKSSLINSWLSRLDQENYRGANQVYAWSFYWQGSSADIKSSGDYFIEHALDWFGDQKPSEGTPWAKATRLADLIKSSRTLLILDGLEPMQYPPGPKAGQVENPAVALLIRELASDNNGLCVITSRLGVSDMNAFDDGRVESIHLRPLSTSASIKLLKSMGTHGSDDDHLQAVKEYSGHPLSLSLLGGYLSVVHQGEIKDYKKIKSLLDEQSMGAHARNLMRNYLDWFEGKPECALLLMIGLFDRAVRLEDIKFLATQKTAIEHLTSELCDLGFAQWSYAVDKLSEANLISVYQKNDQTVLDCHPLVRDYLADYLVSERKNMWAEGHELIFEYLQEQAVSNPSNMAELEPLFRAVIHGTQAGLYEEAFQLYFEKIKKRQFSMSTEGSHHADQACIRAFFKQEWTEPVKELHESARFYLLSCASANLIYLGKIHDAIASSSISIAWFLENEMWVEAINTAAPLASMLIAAGKLSEAMTLIDDMEDCVSNTNNSVIGAISSSFKAYTLHLTGQDEKAKTLFEQAESILIQSKPDSPVSFPTVSSYYCKYLLDTGSCQEALQRSLKTFAWRKEKSWQVAVDTTSLLASDIQVLGLIFLELGDHVNAKIYLNKQVDLFKAADELLYLPTGLNARAKLHIKVNDFQAAISDLEEALQVSRRTGAKFGEWEAYINLAQLYYERQDFTLSETYLQKAKDIPDMGLYRFRDAEISNLENMH
ncbi:MAG: tetratricopeptide repeat protein [Gammaproteobacteria bacterium]|nr:tetratricopeptide repeat protein [Gammaproteobacteria bacterium]